MHPKSRYDQIIKNLAAETHVQLHKRDGLDSDFSKYRGLYRYLNETYPDSVLTPRNRLILIYSSLKKGEALSALTDILAFQKDYPHAKEKYDLEFARAQALQALKRFKAARRVYKDLRASAAPPEVKVEALYRFGDLEMAQGQYQKAYDLYQKAMKKQPLYEGVFPNALFNSSESLFWLGKYKEALDSYIKFIKTFPTHKHGGYAIARIGEALEILGASDRQIIGTYTEGFFRFPDSPGSEVARIRMLSQGLKNMTAREKKRAMQEIQEIVDRSKLPNIEEFSVVMKGDGLSRRKEFKESLGLLLEYYQNNPTTVNQQVFGARILRNMADILKSEVDKNHFIEALNFYGKYMPTWLKNSDRIDTEFYQAWAYEKAGVPAKAQKIYKKISRRLPQLGGRERISRGFHEHLPSSGKVQLRLAAVNVDQRRYKEAYRNLKRARGALTPEEKIERVRLEAIVAENMGNVRRAIGKLESFVSKVEKPEGLEPVKVHLGQLYLKNRQLSKAEDLVSDLESAKVLEPKEDDQLWIEAQELKGDVLLARGQELAAVESYVELLNHLESSQEIPSLRYKAGRILFEQGDLKGAEKIWSGISGQHSEFYKKLATEKLSHAKWQDNYKKYINRIPAAEKLQ